MAFFRQFVAPLLIVLVFLVALAATSARIFLPDGLSAPAPIEEFSPQEKSAQVQTPTTVSHFPLFELS